MRLIFPSDKLNPEEEKVRDKMIYSFNPALKFIFLQEGCKRFSEFAFNSCRQTAIFGAHYLTKLLPAYTFTAYEGDFVETMEGVVVPYKHAFIVGKKGKRLLLVDLARTTKPLVFTVISKMGEFPDYDEYKDVALIKYTKLNLEESIGTNVPEYITNKKPREVVAMIDKYINQLQSDPLMAQLEFCDKIYSLTTGLKR